MRRTDWWTGWAKGRGAWEGSAQRTGNAWGVRWGEAAGYVNLATVDRMHSGDNVRQKMETAQEVGWSFRDFGT